MDEFFAHLAIMHLFSVERPLNFVLKKLVTVGGKLERLFDTQLQVLHIFFNRAGGAFADHPIDDEFAVRVHAKKNGLPSTLRVFRPIIFFLTADEAKEFVNLDKRKSDLAHTVIEEEGAFASRRFQNCLNGVWMSPREPCSCKNAYAFHEQINDLRYPSKRRFDPAEWPVWNVRKSFSA